jgi:hypothetical protein
MKISLHDTRWKLVWTILALGALALFAVALRDPGFRADTIRGIAILLDSKASAAVVAGLAACLGVVAYHWADQRRRSREEGAWSRRQLTERQVAFVDEALVRVQHLEDLVYEVLTLLEQGDRETAATKLTGSRELAALTATVRRAEVFLPPRILKLTTGLHRAWQELQQKRSPEAGGEVHRALASFRNELRSLVGTEPPSYSLQVAFNETLQG